MKDRDLTIGVARGIAIILVLYGHVIQRSMLPNGADFFLNPAFKIIYAFHMPLFFFISGYALAFSLSRRSILDVLKARSKSLLVPFLIWGSIGIFMNYGLGMMDGKRDIAISSLKDLVEQLSSNPVIWIWFLFTLFVSSCLLLCSIQLEKRIGPVIFPLVYLLILLIPYNDYCSLYYIQWFYLFYVVGYCVHRYGIRITHPVIDKIVMLLVITAFVVFVSFWQKNDYIYINKISSVRVRIFADGLSLCRGLFRHRGYILYRPVLFENQARESSRPHRRLFSGHLFDSKIYCRRDLSHTGFSYAYVL
jgi:fucose 4-O-acetylase-like acetyltransferase